MKTSAKSVIKATAISIALLASLSLTGCSTPDAPESVPAGDGAPNSASAREISVFTIAYGMFETDCVLQSMFQKPGSMKCDFANKRLRHPGTSEAPLGTDVAHSTATVHGKIVDCISYQAFQTPGGIDCDFDSLPVKEIKTS